MKFTTWLAVLFAFASLPVSTMAETPSSASPNSFITLGTQGGPVSSPHRSQPANVLIRGPDAYIVDAGDGAVQRLAQAGLSLNSVRAVFLSHLHSDHTAGLGAILALRHQMGVPGVLAVYGPPGTQKLVDHLLLSMEPGAEIGNGYPGVAYTPPQATARAIEIAGGETTELPGIRVTSVQNSHYSFAPASPEDAKYRSLSYRFDMPERSIVYSGDTGPSTAVEQLATGADLLIVEMMNADAVLSSLKVVAPNMPPSAREGLRRHLVGHHVSAEQVGELASRARAKRVVITHISPAVVTDEQDAAYKTDIAKRFRGAVEIANDLDRF